MYKFLITLLLTAIAGCSSTSVQASDTTCQFPSKPTVILKKGNHLLQYWDYEEGSLSNKTNFQSLSFLKSYQRRVRSKVEDLSQEALRSRSYPHEKPGDQQNMRVVKHLVKSVRSINCQEALLLNLQGSRVDLVINPTEFLTFELKKGKKIRLFYVTSNSGGVRGLGDIHEKIESFINEGWSLEKNTHNHILNLNDENYRGTLGPSVSDAFVYQMELKDFNPPKAIITNGFDSMEIPPSLFEKLSTKF